MSIAVLSAIWIDPPCKGGDLLVLLALADNADERGIGWPSMETIARKAAMSERGARKCIRNLEKAGLIVVKEGGGRAKSSKYQITTNGIGQDATHKKPEQSSGNKNPEQSSIKAEQSSPISDETRNNATENPEPGFRGTVIEPYIGGGGDARERVHDTTTFRERLLSAMGADPISGLTGPTGKMIGRASDLIEAKRWRNDLDLSEDEILSVVADVMRSKRDGPPGTFSYFTGAMQRFAGQKRRPTLTPIDGGYRDPSSQNRSDSRSDAAAREIAFAARFARSPSGDFR